MIPLHKATIFFNGLDHPECVAVHPDGSVWAGGEAGQIYRISKDGKEIEQVANTGGFVLGIAFSPDLRWLAICDLKKQCLWQLNLKTNRLGLFSRGVGRRNRLSIPNYPAFATDGTLYVSDSGTFRQINGRIFRFDPDGRGEVWHAGPFNFSNGLAFSPRQDAIFVACSWLPGVERIEIKPDGSAGKRSIYAKFPKTCPDGIAFDQNGNLYVSCYAPSRIYKVDTRQKLSILVDDWESHTLCNPTNIAFGGEKFDQLFVSNLGRWHITQIDFGIKGAPLACQRQNET